LILRFSIGRSAKKNYHLSQPVVYSLKHNSIRFQASV